MCGDGYIYDDEKSACADINECLQLPCKSGQTCKNLVGSFTCMCPRGYELDADTGDCGDTDECARGYCGEDVCINTPGSYKCICPPGFKQIGRFCSDINECISKPCGDDQYCMNTRGSYKCDCKMGYEKFLLAGGRQQCIDVDECAQGMCTAYGETCKNLMGSYKCVCMEGYVMTGGRYCKDLNECDLNSCPENSECINTIGSFHCRCHRGFKMEDNGKSCIDERGCGRDEGSKCQWRCKESPGSNECECPPGYDQSDFSCMDKNECDVIGEMACNGTTEQCINTRGGYECIDHISCPSAEFYKKLTRTDEFGRRGRRQYTTNICRRRRCRQFKEDDNAQKSRWGSFSRNSESKYDECRGSPMSVSYHYIDITSQLEAPRRIFRVRMKTRRRRQRYDFQMVSGDRETFGLKQVSPSVPTAYIMLKQEITGPMKYQVVVDMTTYNRKGKKRDTRMATVTVYVSEYDF